MAAWTMRAGVGGLWAMLAASVGYGVFNVLSDAPASRWLGLDIAWQCWSMTMFGAIVIRGRVAVHHWGWAALAAGALSVGDPLANRLHPFLMEHGLYPWFWGRGVDPQQSPQYARLLVWTILCAAAWARCLGQRLFPRSAPTAIALLGASSVLATSAIFHVAIVSMAKHYEREQTAQAKAMLASPGTEGFAQWCAASGSLCAQGQEAVSKAVEGLPASAREHARSTVEAVAAAGAGSFAWWRQPTEEKTFNRLPSMMAAAGVSSSGEVRIWADFRRIRADLEELEKVFAWLALWAHGFWLWGSALLAWWHAKRGGAKT